MITVISPAKSMDFESPLTITKSTQPQFLKQSIALVSQLKKLPPHGIASLMKLSDKLALLNFDRYQSFTTPFTSNNARQALLAFKGDVYQGLDAETLTSADLKFAQQHLRILSGLYGVLKPLDLIQAYRLEMGTKFENREGKNLYAFWGVQLTDHLDEELAGEKHPILVNLASNEYFKAVKANKLSCRVVTPVFKDRKNGQYKIISFYAKRARGLMSRFIIQNRIDNPDDLKDFHLGGYYFDQTASSTEQLTFLRDEPTS